MVKFNLRTILFTEGFKSLCNGNNPLQIVPAYFHFYIFSCPAFLLLIILKPPFILSLWCQIRQIQGSHNKIRIILITQLDITVLIKSILINLPLNHKLSNRSLFQHLPSKYLNIPFIYFRINSFLKISFTDFLLYSHGLLLGDLSLCYLGDL